VWSPRTDDYWDLSSRYARAAGGRWRYDISRGRYWLNKGGPQFGQTPNVEILIWHKLHDLESELQLMPFTPEYLAYWKSAVELAGGLCGALCARRVAEEHCRRVVDDARTLSISGGDGVVVLARSELVRCSDAVEQAGGAVLAAIESNICALVAIRRREQSEVAAMRRAEIGALEAAGMDSRPEGAREADNVVERAQSMTLEAEGIAVANNREADLFDALGA
jgi:hypothetical protein